YGFGVSIVMSGVYVTPTTVGVLVTGLAAGVIAHRFGSRSATIVGSAMTSVALVILALANSSPWGVLLSMACFGVGIGLAFAALGNLVVEAVEPHQTGAAGGMNTVMRMIGGALGGRLSAAFLAAHTLPDGHPALHGFVEAWGMQAAFLFVCTLAALLVPRRRPF